MAERKLTPDWHSERFYKDTVKPNLDRNVSFIMEWHVVKQSMIATLNYLRAKHNLKCEWIEKSEGLFMIKISKQ